MRDHSTYVLIHSPLVGPLTWTVVAEQLRTRGLEAVIPHLHDSADTPEPFWEQHVDSVARGLDQLPIDGAVILVAHSGAGPLLPAIRQAIPHPVRGYVFVDAGIPVAGATRLDMMRSEDPAWAMTLEQELRAGARFPSWRMDDLKDVIPDEVWRRQMVSELRPRGLSFFTESIPVFDGWPDAACAYIRFSAPYQALAARARGLGWPMYELEAGHFHMLVDPAAVTDLIVDAAGRYSS